MDYVRINWAENLPRSNQYEDTYFSSSGGLSESEYVFIEKNNLTERFQRAERFVIAEAGFGTGLNFVATCKHWLLHAPSDAVLSYIGIEKHPVSPLDIKRILLEWDELEPFYTELLFQYPEAVSGSHFLRLFNGRVLLHLEFSDIKEVLADMRFNSDAWFMDGFNPKSNMDMWDAEVFELVAANSKQGTSLSTYTAAGHVKRNLENSGFQVIKVKGHAKKREMITAIYDSGKTNRKKIQNVVQPWFEMPNQTSKDKSVVIIGAGLAGLTTARALVDRGCNVTVIDQHKKIASEASGNPAGILLPRISLGNIVEEEFYVNAFFYAVNQLKMCQLEAKEEFWHATGVCSKEPVERAHKILSKYKYNKHFVNDDKCDYDDVCVTKSETIISFPAAGWVNTHSLCENLFKKLSQNIKFIRATVDDLKKNEKGWSVLSNDSEIAAAPTVVMASGVAVNQFDLTSWLPITFVRGQMTEIEANAKSRGFKQALSYGRFLTPSYNGKHYTGASYDLSNSSKELSVKNQDDNLEELNKILPDIFAKPDDLSGRVGFRAVSEDRMPIVGLLPDKNWFFEHYKELHHGKTNLQYPPGQYEQGLYINSAHGSRGLTTCFISAELIAASIDGTPNPFANRVANALSPTRYLIRRLKQNKVDV